MLPLRKILFPYDFSDMCTNTARFVHDLACQAGAEVTLLTVLPPPWDFGFTGPPAQTAELADLKKKLDSALVTELAGLRLERVVEQGDPASIIVNFAHSHGIDLIMMPTHGLGPYRGLLLGSVTAKVLHDSHCPVWTAPHVEDPLLSEHSTCHHVLCAIDGTPKSQGILEYGAGLARDLNSTLRVIHAVPSITDWPSLASERRLQEEVRKEAEAAVRRLLTASLLDVPLNVLVGDIAQVTHDEALRTQADLLVIGRGTLTEPMGRLRTHSIAIIRRAPCPVISV
jgi:nucleotide-binding universal stress UspA family protein